MWPEIFRWGNFALFWWEIYVMVAIVVTGFSIWKELREEYGNNEIFEFETFLLTSIALGSAAGSVVESGKLWGFYGWAVVVSSIWCIKKWSYDKDWDFWELLDLGSRTGLVLWFWGSVFYGPAALSAGVVAVSFLAMWWYVKKNYRRFSWYSSGKPGLPGLLVIMSYAAYEIVTGVLTQSRVFFWGLTMGQTVGAFVFAFSAVAVYLRGGRKLYGRR